MGEGLTQKSEKRGREKQREKRKNTKRQEIAKNPAKFWRNEIVL
jgi:hypothetical protein